MRDKKWLICLLLFVFTLGTAAAASTEESDPYAPQPDGRPQPGLLDTRGVKFEIVDHKFLTYLEGANDTEFEESEPDYYRGLLLTIRITKPAGQYLRITAYDMVLHYYYGENYDIAKCYGLSSFSTTLETDRPINLYSNGYGHVTSGNATTEAEVVYIDLFFQLMEAETSDLHLYVAQPVGAYAESAGWQN